MYYLLFTQQKVHAKELFQSRRAKPGPKTPPSLLPARPRGTNSLEVHPLAAWVYVGHGDTAEPGTKARLGHAASGPVGWASSPKLFLQTRAAHGVVSLCVFPPELHHGQVVLPLVFSDF